MVKFIKFKTEVEYDFSAPITLEVWSRIKSIISFQSQNFTDELEFSLQKESDASPELYKLKAENSKWGLYRNGQQLDITSLSDLLKDKLGVSLDLLAREVSSSNQDYLSNLNKGVLDLGNSEIAEIEKELTVLNDNLAKSFSDEQKEKYSRLQEVEERIESIQEEIDYYQNEKKIRDELNSKIKKTKTSHQAIEQQLSSVELLIVKKNELDSKLKAFGDSDSLIQQVEALKQSKIEHLYSTLNTINANPVRIQPEEVQKKNGIKLDPFLSVIFLNIFLGVVTFLYSFSLVILLILLTSSIALFVFYILDKFFTQSLEGIDAEDHPNSMFEVNSKMQESTIKKSDPNTQLFINSAWLKALLSEIQLIGENISKNLSGKDYESMKKEKESLLEELNLLENNLKELSEKSITSDEYYKKRRELDILKIEKENIEFGLKIERSQLDNKAKLQLKLKRVKKIISSLESLGLPIILVGNIAQEALSQLKAKFNGQIILVNQN